MNVEFIGHPIDEMVEYVGVGIPFAEALELIEKAPKDPTELAYHRMQALSDRGADVEKLSLLRIRKTKSPAKIDGIVKAAKQLGFKEIAKAARARLKEL